MNAFKAACVVFAIHAALLFFPPLPPLHKGSLWSYVLGYLAVFLAWRSHGTWVPGLARWWHGRSPLQRWLRGMAGLLTIGAAALVLRGFLPETFARFSREEGVWEPITLLTYLTAATLLVRSARTAPDDLGRHLRLLASGFVFLTLEEIDYFGVFGGLIGRIDGVYVGTLHDLIVLAAEGLLHPAASVALGALVVSGGWWLWHLEYLQPRRIARMGTGPQGLWLVAGTAFLVAAAIEEAGLLGRQFGPPSPEELFEMLGALCLGGFTLIAVSDLPAAPGPGTDSEPPASGDPRRSRPVSGTPSAG